jgi:hypothetical protein
MNVMNRWQLFTAASLVSSFLAPACSDTAENKPSGLGGGAGSTQGGSAGTAGSPGKAGSSPQAGNASSGGSRAGEAGSTSGGGEGAPEGGSGGAPTSDPGRAMMGEVCPLETLIGVVQLAGFPAPYVQVALYDRPEPWITEAELTTPSCAFHHYTPGVCQGCEAGEVCSFESECVPEPRTIKDATLLVSTGSEEREYSADAQLGGIYSMLDIGNADSSFAMTLSWGDTEVTLDPMPVASGELQNAMVTIEGDSSMPGALDASWQPSGQGAFVRSRIPINHHAAGPTFTECAVPENAGAFHADAEMVNPLAVETGLEFQGLEHIFVAAATTPEGCVEFRFGEQVFVFPN